MDNRRGYFGAIVAGLLLTAGSLAAPPSDRDITRAIQQLGDDRYTVREQATEFLWKAGRAAEPALRSALRSSDLEVASRAKAILEKFKWGIYPDTPKLVVEAVRRYQEATDWKQKLAALDPIIKSDAALGSAYAIVAADEESSTRSMLFRALELETQRRVPQILRQGKADQVDKLLEAALVSERDEAARNHAVWQLLRGRLDQAIARLRGGLPGLSPASRELALIYLLRGKGDMTEAIRAAEEAKKPELATLLRWEGRDWQGLLRQLPPGRDSPQSLGQRAAIARRAGDMKEFAAIVEQLRGVGAPGKNAEARHGDIQSRAKFLLLNERPQDAIELLRQAGEPDKGLVSAAGLAMDLLSARMQFREAMAVGELARPADPFVLDVYRARLLCLLGDKQKAVAVFTSLGQQIHDDGLKIPAYKLLIEKEMELGLKNQALEHVAAVLGLVPVERDLSRVLESAFPGQAEEAELWWKFLRFKHTNVPPVELLKRLADIMDGRLPPSELRQWARDSEDWVKRLPLEQARLWVETVADKLSAVGAEDVAESLLTKHAEDPRFAIPALSRLAEMRMKRGQWQDAINSYERLWKIWAQGESEPSSELALALFFWGECEVRAGRKAEGERLKETAHWMALADDRDRLLFAEALAHRGHEDDARREFEIVLRTGQMGEGYRRFTLARLVETAVVRGDYSGAAGYQEALLAEAVRSADDSNVSAYLLLLPPCRVHELRARELMLAKRFDRAQNEIEQALALFPGQVELAIDLCPILKRSGREREADVLFKRLSSFYETALGQYPASATLHNSLAWLAARCHRELDQALGHAESAVRLEPNEAGYIDTLAEVYFQRGNQSKAIETIRRCIELTPKNGYYRRQLVRMQKGDPAVDVPPQDS
jgi:tetratricopeptide (TPR) repeat protein